LNDRFPTYSFFTAVLLMPPAGAGAQHTRLKSQDLGAGGLAQVGHTRLKRALQLLRSILLQVPAAVNHGGCGEDSLEFAAATCDSLR
jgi:hypothetical protein